MRVLLVGHRYPPAHRAGTELYTRELATRLAGRGHEVHVACAEKDVSRPDTGWVEREHEGLPVHELTRNLFHADFRETWDDPRVDARFAELLDRLRPDVVHAQHLMYLSAGLFAQARARGAATVFTAHDFWLECPRLGQLVHADGALCRTVDFARCGTCLPSFEWRQPPAARGAARVLAAVRSATGVDLGPWAAGLSRRWRARPPARAGAAGAAPRVDLEPALVERFRARAEERAAALRARFRADVQHVFAPSRFLRERLVAFGLDGAAVEHLPTGVDRSGLVPRAAPPGRGGGALGVLFLGSLVPLKGAHVLLDAWERLDPVRRAGARLELFGPRGPAPAYETELERRARALGARLGPALDRAGVAAALARADLVVVPSLWFENRPLVILEALAARVPVLVSDLGGAAELVEPGRGGWRFPAGDAAELARRLAELCARPERLGELAGAREEDLPGWDVLVERCLAVYARCRAEREAQERRP